MLKFADWKPLLSHDAPILSYITFNLIITIKLLLVLYEKSTSGAINLFWDGKCKTTNDGIVRCNAPINCSYAPVHGIATVKIVVQLTLIVLDILPS